MLTEKETQATVQRVTDDIEIAPFVEPTHKVHHDQHVEYTHELPDDTSEATSRSLIRVVPLAYGGLLGGLVDNMLLGVSVGATASAAFDLHMGEHSIARPAWQWLVNKACPAVAAAANGLAAIIGHLGLKSLATALSRVRCGVVRH
jgi:hypothetical protein